MIIKVRMFMILKSKKMHANMPKKKPSMSLKQFKMLKYFEKLYFSLSITNKLNIFDISLIKTMFHIPRSRDL